MIEEEEVILEAEKTMTVNQLAKTEEGEAKKEAKIEEAN